MTQAAQKAALRKRAFAARKAAHGNGGEGARKAALAARDRFLAAGMHASAKVIAAYCPIRTEIDPTPLMDALHAAGHEVCVPVIRGAGLSLQFAAWTPGMAMVAGPFGAVVPANPRWVQPGFLIVPLLAFDARGWRLGYGGGFYDRTLEELRAADPIRAVGLAYAAQQVPSVPREPSDQPLDAVVTEQEIIDPQPG